MVKCFKRLLIKLLNSREVPEDWKVSCIIHVYKRKVDKSEYPSYKGNYLLYIPVE